uniref:mitogen-activated protein kinase kinase n=1 Tax=Globisporangium ultimum (strain ATCC 200006 / CBS 805.95 / DAOM BR144) TaxID=431595 RepID=K3W5N2_GLOUD
MDLAKRYGGADTCLYGSVVDADALRALDSRRVSSTSASTASPASVSVDGHSAGCSGAASPVGCDECERAPARVECEDCGLVYCAPCDAHRHRKGKLLFHQRKALTGPTVEPPMYRNGESPQNQTLHDQDEALLQQQEDDNALRWGVNKVVSWLNEHDLELFVDEITAHSINGAFLLSPLMETFLDSQSSAARGHKKKLLREVQKLKADSTLSDSHSISKAKLVTQSLATKCAIDEPAQPPQLSSMRRIGVNLRVNVNTSPASSSSEQSFSPVTSLRSRLNHGQQGDEMKGRVSRRRSTATESPLPSPSPIPAVAPVETKSSVKKPSSLLKINTSDEAPRRRKSVVFAAHQLQIDVHDTAKLVRTENNGDQQVLHEHQERREYHEVAMRQETRPGGRTNLRSIRQALVGGLDLDILQVKNEERAVEASFDFSAEGRLQTQGFEINTHGIANVPFPHHHASKKAALGTREFLVILNELGHGAGGKVYKALYMPTFQLLAVKVIRVYDQKKRHQMVRELKSLYVNFVPINDSCNKAACDELVVFYDAYTNPEIGSVSIVLEFMNGGSLEDTLQSERKVGEKELANMAYCVLKGLAFLHEHHQLHRDIKLSNMLINHQGHVKISDFGISRDLESTLAKATTFTGTLLYMAPERISGGMYSYPSDIWSFGLAIMALAVGKLPVPTKDGYWGVVHAVQEQPSPRLADYGDHFSPALCDFIDQCLQKNPMHRPPAATLLEHAFIRDNYSPRSATAARETSEQQQVEDNNKAMQELELMVVKVRAWCQSHAETLLSPTFASTNSEGGHGDAASLLQQISNDARIEALAQQMHLPKHVVAAKFAFLNTYCK